MGVVLMCEQLTLSAFADCLLQVEPSEQVRDQILRTAADSDIGYIVEVSVDVQKPVMFLQNRSACVCVFAWLFMAMIALFLS